MKKIIPILLFSGTVCAPDHQRAVVTQPDNSYVQWLRNKEIPCVAGSCMGTTIATGGLATATVCSPPSTALPLFLATGGSTLLTLALSCRLVYVLCDRVRCNGSNLEFEDA